MRAKPRHQRRAVERLELVEAAAVHQPRDDLAHVEALARVGRDDAVEVARVVLRLLRRGNLPGILLAPVEVADDRADDGQRVLVVERVVVGDAGGAAMHVGAAQLLGADLFAGRGLHQRRPGQEDRAVAAHDHGLVAHRRDVRAARRAGAHHRRDLRDALGRHLRLVVEDAPEVVAVGEDVGLERQEGAAGVHQVDAGQAVLLGDLLRAQVLLDGHREVGAALDRRVVGDDHALLPLDRRRCR